MSQKQPDNARARDDRHLRQLVSETREWMQAQGIKEQPLDWEAVAGAEEAQWWKERLRQALGALAARANEFAESIAVRLRQLVAAPDPGAEAALEVNFEAEPQVGRIRWEPAQACVRSDAVFQFAYAQAALRSKLGLGEGQDESAGIFIASAIPGARVIANAQQQTVTVEFWEPLPSPLVILVPEDSTLTPYIAQATVVDGTARVRFEAVQPGRYLLSVYVAGEGTV